ncbi:NAD(P)-binding protein [Legionella maioricensis]|uniref:Uncharacterized protein n=1 Tax=Legionella maioricensis TaxID=2896528 RepID=A0A9X2D3H0_9GAMM|nr:NAD(P)-binding protein [Legionella maioricensis]MCL9685783.1 hypothetical protein [Legionella maioricensis]MCL9689200.1 hypothetical protein [Legionella maioricensis]
MGQLQADFCIIGVGFSDLAAAYKLMRAGYSVRVLEPGDPTFSTQCANHQRHSHTYRFNIQLVL